LQKATPGEAVSRYNPQQKRHEKRQTKAQRKRTPTKQQPSGLFQ